MYRRSLLPLLRTRIAREPSRRTGADAFLALVLLAGGTLPARADFQTCLAGLRVTAIAGGVSGETFDQATRGLEPNPDVIAASLSQPEFKTAIWDYLAGLVDDERVADGQAMMRKWEQALASAQSRFGVDPAVVTAVWGVEVEFRPGLRHQADRPIARHPVLRRAAAALFPQGIRGCAENPPGRRYRSATVQGIVGGRVRAYAVHALDVPAHRRRRRRRRQARPRRVRSPMPWPPPPTICTRAAGSRAWPGASR